jgi:hypothetical protein
MSGRHKRGGSGERVEVSSRIHRDFRHPDRCRFGGCIFPASADTGTADTYIDQLAEAADTPSLSWISCVDGFLCAAAEVPRQIDPLIVWLTVVER